MNRYSANNHHKNNRWFITFALILLNSALNASTSATTSPTVDVDDHQAAYFKIYSWKKFAPLFSNLSTQISPAEIDNLQSVLFEREMIFANAKRDAQTQKIDFNLYLKTQTNNLREKLIQNFGRPVADQVDAYIHTLPQRKMIGELNLILTYQNSALTVKEIERLALLINTYEPSGQPSLKTDGDINDFIKSRETAFNSIITEAKVFLRPIQIEIFRKEFDLQINNLIAHKETLKQAFIQTTLKEHPTSI